MTIYPAIDIKSGRCVRLIQGLADQETVYAEDPVAVAADFKHSGSAWVHVVDLDGAFAGEPANLGAVQAIVSTGLKVQLGGGLRTRAAVDRAIQAGVHRVVIGTRAAESISFVSELVEAYGDKIAVGIDAKDGRVAVKGWVITTNHGAVDFACSMDAIGVSTLIYTDIGTDGMLIGPNYEAQETLARAVKAQVIASGGVSQLADVVRLNELSLRIRNLHGVIIGKALYEKRLTLGEAMAVVK
jgi:phosphoribosylformimino-5-aminoimidazole carboxamide ribotide isomerase